jgi:hypothetical protein
MGDQPAEKEKRRPAAKDLWRLALLILGVIAVIQELRKPAEDRTWHGTVAGFVPYDLRKPTMDRVRETYWNPDGAIVSSMVWGVGWALNAGAIKKRLGG